jgi:transcriptional regulator with XRE-family HTH domain
MKLRLKYWRERRAMSIRKLSEVAKVTTQTIVNLEKQRQAPQPSTIQDLAKALNITIDDLIDDTISQVTHV